MKKLLALVLALVMVLGLCACGGKGGASNGGEGGGELTADGRVKLTLGLPTNAYIMDYDDNALTRWIEEKCGVEIEFIEYAGGTDVSTQISTTISARQELPDILFGIGLEENTIDRYGKEGYLVDLAPYMYDENGEPDLDGPAAIYWDRINNELTEQERETVLRTMEDPITGAVYGMPTIETSLIDKMPYQLWINTKWLEKVNLQKPTNNEELVEVLRAFKNLGMPIYGSQKVNLGSRIIDWLINTFVYFNPNRPFLVSSDGKTLSYVRTDENYRKALQFVHDLYKEGLINDLAWSAGSGEMKQVTTPSSGEAMVGMFGGHLTIHAQEGNEVMYEYEPLKSWGNVVRYDISCSVRTFITADCKNPEKALEVLMNLFSWDGSMRIRYGEYGANWTDADPGAKSDVGLDAKYKLQLDPLVVQNTAVWGKIACCLNIMAEGEEAQVGENLSPWHVKKSAMHAESNRLFEESEKEMLDRGVIQCPKLRLTEEEKEEYEMVITNVGTYASRAQTDFCKGLAGFDPYSDTDWENYCKELENLGLADYMKVHQMAFDRGNS